MNGIIEQAGRFNEWLGRIIWGPCTIALVLGTGLYLSFRLGFFQVRHFRDVLRNTVFHKPARKGGLSSLAAASTSLAGTLGVGNIAGVAAALTAGGPGAMFWMWVSALLGMATKYAEIYLAVEFRQTGRDGTRYGGPMYYMERGLKSRWLAVLFSLFCLFCALFGMGNMAQGHTISSALKGAFGLSPIFTALGLSLFIAYLIFGGLSRISSFTLWMVPLMSLFYIGGCLWIILLHADRILPALGDIFASALGFRSAAAGMGGYAVSVALRSGLSKGIFSNEAGLGSSPIVHAASNADSPSRQGMWGVFEVFADTVVICSITAFALLTSGVCDGVKTGIDLTLSAFSSAFGRWGGALLSVSVVLFAVATIPGWFYYGQTSLQYLTGSPRALLIYKLSFVALTAISCVAGFDLIWGIADTVNGLMLFPNLAAVLLLSPRVVRGTREGLPRPTREAKKKEIIKISPLAH